ncbi:MAG TPA: hypothetical protein VF519_06070 [Mycobacteriales bacterium]|jgi:stage V sporulation protein SpoVS
MNHNPEDRLRSALGARADAARTSPDALDGVFGRVARHRRNVRLATGAGAALSLVAAAAIANAALRPSGPNDRVIPASPSPGVVTTAPPSPATTTVATTPPPPPPVTAFAVLKDRRVAELDVRTGDVLRTVGTVGASADTRIDVSADRRRVAYATAQCRIAVVDLASGDTLRTVGGYAPALSPDGGRVAVAKCFDGGNEPPTVVVTDVASGTSRSYTTRAKSGTPFEQDVAMLSGVHALAWRDAGTVAVTRTYEGAVETLLLDLARDRYLNDAARSGEYFSDVAAHGGALYGTEECCMPEWDKPTKVVRLDGGRRTVLFQRPGGVTDLSVEPGGTVVFVSGERLWRWDGGGAAKQVRTGVLAVD